MTRRTHKTTDSRGAYSSPHTVEHVRTARPSRVSADAASTALGAQGEQPPDAALAAPTITGWWLPQPDAALVVDDDGVRAVPLTGDVLAAPATIVFGRDRGRSW